MKDLKSFASTEIKQDIVSEIKENVDPSFSEQKLNQAEGDYGGLVHEFLSRYGTMSENELMQEMLKLIQQKKADGTYNPDQIRGAAKQITPLLTPNQRDKMEKLLKFL